MERYSYQIKLRGGCYFVHYIGQPPLPNPQVIVGCHFRGPDALKCPYSTVRNFSPSLPMAGTAYVPVATIGQQGQERSKTLRITSNSSKTGWFSEPTATTKQQQRVRVVAMV